MYEIFESLLKDFGVRPIDVANETGISPTVFSEWKKGKSKPNTEKLLKIANYFGVSVEYLATGETTDPVLLARQEMRDEVKALADLASKADPEQVKMATTFLKTIMESVESDT